MKYWKDPGAIDFVRIKKDNPGEFWSSNNSLAVDEEFWREAQIHGTWANKVFKAATRACHHDGEPGFVNVDRLSSTHEGMETLQQKLETVLGSRKYQLTKSGEKLYKELLSRSMQATYSHITNPCVTGDTLVAVADGRGMVRIDELVKTGESVLVYCYDEFGGICAERMIRPRKTGTNLPILEITLDNQHTIRVTKNHKFCLVTGEYVKAESLKPGDCLAAWALLKTNKIPQKSTTSVDAPRRCEICGRTLGTQAPYLPEVCFVQKNAP
ncbi:MAG: hypothetical protein MZV70_29175 [Desulfobacterales bacterium]|nr:hypothetical protein [Desulfobacterales bacterium]